MNTSGRRRAREAAGADRPERGTGASGGRRIPLRITISSCAALLTGTALLLVAGCSGTGTSSTASGSAESTGSGTVARAPAASEPRAAAGSADHGAAVAAARLGPSGQSIVYTANLTVQVPQAGAAASRAVGDISAAGGYTAAEKELADHSRTRRATVSLTLKVPVAGYPAALRQLSALGRQTFLSQQSADVTQQVADVSSRVTSQRDAIAQLRTLLRRAGSVSGLLSVQQQISGDESELESLLAQQRALDHETTYATISLVLVGPRPRPAAVGRSSRHGFGSGLAAGWRGLGHATSWTLTALGVVLPFGVVLGILGGLGYAGWRRIVRRRARPTVTS
jgi:hypothetical protein